MSKLLIPFFLLFNSYSFSQNLPTDDLNFLIEKIKTVYAGYRDKVNETEFNDLINKIKNSNSQDTFSQLSKLTTYFKDHHLSLFNKKILNSIDSSECNNNLRNVTKYLGKKPRHWRDHEGFWIDDDKSCIIFLKRLSTEEYRGYIIETKKRVPPGFCILKMQKEKGGKYISDFVTLTWGGTRVFTTSFFKNNKILIVSSYSKWKKLAICKPGILKREKEFSYNPELKILDSNNILIRMPDFIGYNAKIYDSIIAANETHILKAKNLILDLRNNGGGSTRCFSSLIPFICTNPIIRIGGSQLSSKDVIEDAKKDMDHYIKLKDTATVNEYKDYVEKLEKNKNNFIHFDTDTIFCRPKKNNNIKNVAIIINHGCRSAAELMLLWFKQSSKVKFFGEPTAGAVDYLELFTYMLPKTEYTLWAGTAKRGLNKAKEKYDNVGIKPDIEISDSENDWVEFVKRYYEKN